MPISSNFRQILPTTVDSVALSLYLSPSSAQQMHLSKNCTFWMSYVCLQQNVRLPTKYFKLFVALRNFDLVYPSYSAGVYSTGKLYQMHYATQILPTIVVKKNFFLKLFLCHKISLFLSKDTGVNRMRFRQRNRQNIGFVTWSLLIKEMHFFRFVIIAGSFIFSFWEYPIEAMTNLSL